MKNARQARIIEIVSESEVCTQQEITDILVNEGFKVTQATVSRDLRELNLKKSGNGGKSRSKYNVSDYVSEKNNLKNKMFDPVAGFRWGNLVNAFYGCGSSANYQPNTDINYDNLVSTYISRVRSARKALESYVESVNAEEVK